jgi:hypothetical protein
MMRKTWHREFRALLYAAIAIASAVSLRTYSSGPTNIKTEIELGDHAQKDVIIEKNKSNSS